MPPPVRPLPSVSTKTPLSQPASTAPSGFSSVCVDRSRHWKLLLLAIIVAWIVQQTGGSSLQSTRSFIWGNFDPNTNKAFQSPAQDTLNQASWFCNSLCPSPLVGGCDSAIHTSKAPKGRNLLKVLSSNPKDKASPGHVPQTVSLVTGGGMEITCSWLVISRPTAR